MSSLWYIVNVKAAVVKDGHYLMIVRGKGGSHARGVHTLPGGKVEDNSNTPHVLQKTLLPHTELVDNITERNSQ
jgi:ADP-ribose pyrophosphatase YjhB (NUDIX family)